MRLIFAILILLVGISVFRWILEASRKNKNSGDTEMVQDPNCKTYIPVTEAVQATIAGQDHYFCSEPCADEYRNKHNAA